MILGGGGVLSDMEEKGDATYLKAFMSVLEPGIHSLLQPLIEEFVESGYNSSPTCKLWYEYLTCVSTPFKLLLPQRNPNLEVHQFSKLQLIPLLFAINITYFSRYMPTVLLMMNRLPEGLYQELVEGDLMAH